MGGEALTLPHPHTPCSPGCSPCSWQPLRAGLNHILSPRLQMVVQRGLAPRARELLANSSALEEAVLGEQRRLDLGECHVPRGVPALWDSCPPATLCGGSWIVTVRVRMAAAMGVNFPHCPSKSTPGALQRPAHPDFVTGPQDVEGPGERTREPADGSAVLDEGHVCARSWGEDTRTR